MKSDTNGTHVNTCHRESISVVFWLVPWVLFDFFFFTLSFFAFRILLFIYVYYYYTVFHDDDVSVFKRLADGSARQRGCYNMSVGAP